MDVANLKHETTAEHLRMEGLVPLMGPNLKLDEYRIVLRRFYGFIRSWEVWSKDNAPADLQPVLIERLRSGLIAADLRYLGDSVPKFHYNPLATNFNSRAAFLGAMYVIEGSTLGGQFIARHVEEVLNLLPGRGDSYFRGYGERTGIMWREFQTLLRAVPDDDAREVIDGARIMFLAFEKWMQHLVPIEAA